MKIYLVRNAHAEPAAGQLTDAQRYLSANGRRIARDVAIALSRQGIEVDAVVTSPLVRAVQTAELLATAVGHLGAIEVLPSLGPGVPPHIAASAVTSRGGSVLVVGQEPGIAALGAFLVRTPSFPPMRYGQVSFIDDGAAMWWLHPERLTTERLLVGTG